MKRLKKRTCAYPGCKAKPKRKLGWLCVEHARARELDELASAYLSLAGELDDLATAAAGEGETVPPWPPGPVELGKLARHCRSLAKQRLEAGAQELNLVDRRPGLEVLVDPEQANVLRSRQVVEEGMLLRRPGRPSTHTPITQEQWTKLQAALGLLSWAERKAYWLVRGRGMSHRTAAREMKTDAGNIYNLLKRAEDKLAAWRAGEPAQARLELSDAAD